MTYVVTKIIKGNPYLYLVRSEREGDRVRQIFVRYLGRADSEEAQAKASRLTTEEVPVARRERAEKLAPTPAPEAEPAGITRKGTPFGGEGLDQSMARQLPDGTYQVTPSYNLVSKGFERRIFDSQEEANAYIAELQEVSTKPTPEAIVAPPKIELTPEEITERESRPPIDEFTTRFRGELSKKWGITPTEELRHEQKEVKPEVVEPVSLTPEIIAPPVEPKGEAITTEQPVEPEGGIRKVTPAPEVAKGMTFNKA